MTTNNITTLKDGREPEYNPRVMSETSRAYLEQSMDEFGDLSGITLNRRSGNFIGGNQRTKSLLGKLKEFDIEWGGYYETPRGRERDGFVSMPDGSRWGIREVDFDEAREKAANLSANNLANQGEFQPDKLAELLDEISTENADVFLRLGLDGLRDLEPFDLPEDPGGGRANNNLQKANDNKSTDEKDWIRLIFGDLEVLLPANCYRAVFERVEGADNQRNALLDIFRNGVSF